MKGIKQRFLTIAAACIAAATLGGCGTENNTAAPKREAIVNWEPILSHMEQVQLPIGGLYFKIDNAKRTSRDLDQISFSNYDSDFRAVPYQASITYGRIRKPDVTEKEYYDKAVYKISMLDNQNKDNSFMMICSEDGSSFYEEGSWFLSDDRAKLVTDWLAACSEAMGI